ncbi:MAG: cytochrome C [Gemmatimonadales bacterium]
MPANASQMHLRSAVAAFAILGAVPLASANATKGSASRAHPAGDFVIEGVAANRMMMSNALMNAIAAARAVPAFSRQTGMPCSSCHNQFPQLTPFGRLFKLNGYTLTGLATIGQPGDTGAKKSLALLPIPGIAAMLVSSVTQTSKAAPGTQNGTVALPDQFSIFAAGAITPKIGLFSQFTYAARDGSFGIDNVDLRFADHGTLGEHQIIYGVTLHNNPTVQDVWNTVPAWSFPFMSSSSAPSSIASTLIDGGLSQQVVGLGAYSLFDNLLYTEFTAYRSSPQGFTSPLDSTSVNTASGVIPYWRIALQHETPTTSLMLGTFGFAAHLYPSGISGLTNRYTDVAVDGQIEQRQGTASWIGRASFIHERQQLTATQAAGGADNIDQNVSTARASVAYLPNMRYSMTLGYFQTTGSTDSTLYAPTAMVGSRLGRPNTSGAIGEITYNAWQNARLGLHYTAYSKFNGASTAYDIAGGRNASDNNTLYLYLWTAF